MLSARIHKISTSDKGKCWLTVEVTGEFPYYGLILSTKTAADYTVDQQIMVPPAAIRSMA